MAKVTKLPPPARSDSLIFDTRRAPISGTIHGYNPDELVGKKGYAVLDRMRHDETIKACLFLKKASVVGPGYDVRPSDPTSTRAREAADTMKRLLESVPNTFEQVLWEILSALDYGFSLSETIVHLDENPVRLEVKTRAPHSLDFKQDKHGRMLAITQWQGSGLAEFSPEKFIHFVYQGEFSNPYGTPDIRAAWPTYWAKTNWLQWLSIYGEKFADGAVIARHPATAQKAHVDQVLRVIEHLGARSALAVPEGWSLETLAPPSQPRSMFIETLNALSVLIARALLIPDKLGFSGGAVDAGSLALSKTQLGAFYFVLELLKRQLQACIQRQVIDRLTPYVLGGQVTPPEFVLLPLSEENKEAIAGLWTQAVTGGVVVSDLEDENHFRQLLGFGERKQEKHEEEGNVSDDDDTELVRATAHSGPHPPKESHQQGGTVPALNIVVHTERPRTQAEERCDLKEMGDALDGRELATVLTDGASRLVADLKAQVARMNLKEHPEAIHALKPSPAIVGKIRRGVEQGLDTAFRRGVKSARGELKRARAQMKELEDRKARLGEVERVAYEKLANVFAEATTDEESDEGQGASG